MAVNDINKLAGLTDEQITVIKRRIETFVKSNEFYDKLVNHEKWDRGSKEIKCRRVVKPVVKSDEVVSSAEDVAPRPSKIVVETFKHSVDVYRDKVPYTAEDVMFGYDDIVGICSDTLSEIGVQKLDYIKGAPFFASKCTYTYATSLIGSLAKIAIVFDKNKVKPWGNGRYLALLTPELLEKIRGELVSTSNGIFSDATKEEVDKGIVGHYGRWDFMVSVHDYFYDRANGNQNVVCLARRPNGASPIDVPIMDGVEIIHKPLGSGVMVDVDGNYTADDNNQRGAIAMNINGIGAYINDDLCIIDMAVSETEITKSLLDIGAQSEFVSHSYSDVKTTFSAGTNTSIELGSKDYRLEGTAGSGTEEYFTARGTIVKATVKADAGKTLGTVTAANWVLKDYGGTDDAKGVAIIGFSADFKTAYIELGQHVSVNASKKPEFQIKCTATAS